MIELIDYRNQNLWSQIQENYTIEFKDSLNEEYSCYSQGNNIIFYINRNNLCKDSFTHEMLHVFMRIKEFYFGSSITNLLASNRILNSIISPALIEHIGNCLDHVKMLPVYLEMAFDREKFILDYNLYKCTDEEINQLQKFYKKGNKINTEAVDSYIGRLVSILADPNDKFDYSKHIEKLKKIDPLLFRIVERLINHTKELKLENKKLMDDNYLTVTGNFYENLKKWITSNKIVA
jgi:hypothetical protein